MPSLLNLASKFEEELKARLNQFVGMANTHETVERVVNQVSESLESIMPNTSTNVRVYSPSSTSNDTIWTVWVENSSITATSVNPRITLVTSHGQTLLVDGCHAWFNWTGTGTSSATITDDQIWQNWLRLTPQQVLVPPRVSEEERARREAENRQWLEAEEKRKQEVIAANARAEKLLNQCLTDEQKDDLQRKGFFHLHVGSKKYRIKRGYAGNVELIDSKSEQAEFRYCIHPRDRIPDADAMLAQKLLLETNESEFLRIANRTVLRA